MTKSGQALSGRDVAMLAAGAALTLVAARVMPPLAGRALGAARVTMGGDPFDALARDHRRILGLFDTLERTDESATLRRTVLLFQVKRALMAHALAEEDVVYPLLLDEV